MNSWIGEIGQALLQLFVHPLFYVFFLSSFMIGYFRVKRERKMFSTRIYDSIFEARYSIWSGLAVGFILSILVVCIGVTIPKNILYVVSIVSIVLALCMQTRMMSAAYLFGISLLVPVLLSPLKIDVPFLTSILEGVKNANLGGIALLVGLLLVGEGVLIWWNGSKGTTPSLQDGKRGKKVGAHIVNRFWFVPVFLWIPGDSIQSLFAWWPTLSVGNDMYTLVAFPFVLGFFHKVSGTLPKEAISIIGKRMFAFGFFVVFLAVVGLWVQLVALLAIFIAIIGRYGIPFFEKIADENRPAYFSGRNDGLVVLDVIPTTPAHKMGLQVGEVITKVNGVDVRTIDEFYVALQKNGAHCKLDVIDTNGELRFAQRALYRGEHHELGILFADEHVPLETVYSGKEMNM